MAGETLALQAAAAAGETSAQEIHPFFRRQGQPPVQSSLAFTPAEFCIGESGVWFFSVVWEQGPASAPVEFLDDSGLVRD